MKKLYLILSILVLFLSTMLVSCKSKINNKKVNYMFERLIDKNEPLQFSEIGVQIDDTLIIDKIHKGNLIFISKLQDTIEIDKGDSRFITGIIWINSGENKLSKKQIDTFSMSSKNLNDTIITKFTIVPKYVGNNSIYISLEENVFLYSKKYSKDNNRLLKGSYEIDFPIYVKESN